MSFLDTLFGEDPSYEIHGKYSDDELKEIFDSLPEFGAEEPQYMGFLKQMQDFMEWQMRGRNELLGMYGQDGGALADKFGNTASATANKVFGNLPMRFDEYQSKRGYDVDPSLSADIGKEAGKNNDKLQRKITNRAQQIKLDTVGRMMQQIGTPDYSGISQAGLGADRMEGQLGQQQWQNNFAALQQQYPVPQGQYNPGSPGLFQQLLPTALTFGLTNLLPKIPFGGGYGPYGQYYGPPSPAGSGGFY